MSCDAILANGHEDKSDKVSYTLERDKTCNTLCYLFEWNARDCWSHLTNRPMSLKSSSNLPAILQIGISSCLFESSISIFSWYLEVDIRVLGVFLPDLCPKLVPVFPISVMSPLLILMMAHCHIQFYQQALPMLTPKTIPPLCICMLFHCYNLNQVQCLLLAWLQLLASALAPFEIQPPHTTQSELWKKVNRRMSLSAENPQLTSHGIENEIQTP